MSSLITLLIEDYYEVCKHCRLIVAWVVHLMGKTK